MTDLLIAYQYWLLFVGLLFAGETVLLPALYLAFLGKMDLALVLVIAAAATFISDTFWYLLGRYLPLSKMAQWRFFKKRHERIQKLSGFFRKHQYKTLFFSKFIYGTRSLMQVISGIHKMHMGRYWLVNLGGILTYLTVMIVIGFTVDQTFGQVQTLRFGGLIGFGIYVAIMVAIHLVAKKFLKKNGLSDHSSI